MATVSRVNQEMMEKSDDDSINTYDEEHDTLRERASN